MFHVGRMKSEIQVLISSEDEHCNGEAAQSARIVLQEEMDFLLMSVRRKKRLTNTSPLDSEELSLLLFLTADMNTDVKIGRTFPSGNHMTRADYRRFLFQEGLESWMNDTAMNCFLDLLNERNRNRGLRCIGHDVPQPDFNSVSELFCMYPRKTYCTSTFGFPKIKGGSREELVAAEGWLRKEGATFRNNEVILIPVNEAGRHWVLVAVDVKHMVTVYMDPLYQRTSALETM